MSGLILGLDQGTSSTRCVVLDRDLHERGSAAVPVRCRFPAAGRVEQDPAELTGSARAAIAGALQAAGARASDVAAIGLANQTETFVLAQRDTGAPLHPAIVWQDRRSAGRCEELVRAGHAEWVRERTGLELDATFPATKIAWLLDRLPGARDAAQRGQLAYYDVAGWLLAQLGGEHVAEASNAGRTLLCPLGGADWDDDLLELFGVPRELLPAIVDSDRPLSAGGRKAQLPVTAVLGDQQASLFGLGCLEAGQGKVTLGTGAFVLIAAGASAPAPAPGVLGSCAWRAGGETRYALEGFVPSAGATVTWLSELGVLTAPEALDGVLSGAGPETDTVVCVPALQGLGTPSWDAGARGTVLGLTRATTPGQLARAAIDGVLHQIADALTAIRATMPVIELLLDGGLSRSDWVVRRLAELAAVRVARSARGEATALGAARLAGVAAGVWESAARLPAPELDLVAEPNWGEDRLATVRARWAQALALARDWGEGPA